MADESTGRKFGAGAGAAALRQGVKELGAALKAFPDSISVEETGGAFSPTQGEIAESNRGGTVLGRVRDGQERAAAGRPDPDKGIDRD